MIKFESFVLNNGLKVIVHEDHSTPMVCMNLLYNVGARNEDPGRTGFAHLFEHLMFGGSVNIPNYDEPLQRAGGDNNAFTNSDITNYYLTLPAENLETAFWLESDRMLRLAFSEKSLDVQRQVVIEEFKQRYLNQPYGDVWLLLKPLAYRVHPYRWNTIGKEIGHIEQAKMEDVVGFFEQWYHPGNAILVVAGKTSPAEVRTLAEKWFGPIAAGPVVRRELPVEPEQTEKRFLHVKRNVPANAVYLAWHIPERTHPMYPAYDLISDMLGNGMSSRLYKALVKEKQIFSEITAYVSGDRDPGLLIINGKTLSGISSEAGENAILEVLEVFREQVNEAELQKVKTKMESVFSFNNVGILNKAMTLAYFEWLGNAADINEEIAKYRMVSLDQIRHALQSFTNINLSTLYYSKEAEA